MGAEQPVTGGHSGRTGIWLMSGRRMTVSSSSRSGTDYAFLLQTNDLVLNPIRSEVRLDLMNSANPFLQWKRPRLFLNEHDCAGKFQICS